MGATVDEIAEFVKVDRATIHRWMLVHPEFCDAMRIGREAADARVERTLYEKAVAGEAWAVTKWLNNRMPREWGSNPADPGGASVNIIDARQQVIYEQLDDDSLRAIAKLKHLAAQSGFGGADPADAGGGEAGEVQP
jgi:hypothetical protein